MQRSLLLAGLALLLSSMPGESWPRQAQREALGLGLEGSQRALLLEELKAGLLSSMGLEKEPRGSPGGRLEGRPGGRGEGRPGGGREGRAGGRVGGRPGGAGERWGRADRGDSWGHRL